MGQHGGDYPAPAYGAHPAPAQGGRKRRSGTSVDCSKNSDDPACNERKRRHTCDGDVVECKKNRKRREAKIDCSENSSNPACKNRKRRDTKNCDGEDECENKR